MNIAKKNLKVQLFRLTVYIINKHWWWSSVSRDRQHF